MTETQKVVLSNRYYFRPDSAAHLKHIQDSLTYKIEKKTGHKSKFKTLEIVKNFKMLPKGIISIPQGRDDLLPSEFVLVDKRIIHEVPWPDPLIPLREGQLDVCREVEDSCFINALVGWGKSYTALHIAHKLGQKTLIITHTTALRDQWIENVKELFGIEAGIIGSGAFDIEDHCVVVGNIQTVTKLLPELNKEFGLVVMDECLDYNSTINTLENGKMTIGNIVNNKIPVHVLSMDPTTGVSSYKKVLNYYKTPHTDCLKISHSGGGSIKCTENHGMYSYIDGNIEKIPAKYLETGDYLLQTVTNHKSSHILNTEWKDIVLGLILGDGNIGYPHSNSDSIRLKVTHGQAQFEYLEWKKSILGDATECTSKSGYKSENLIRAITTKSFYDVDRWYESMYVNGSKKKIPKSVSERLSILSWALLFQDDGSASQSNDSLTFSVCELDEESVNNLIDSLYSLFNITDAKQFVCSKGFRYLRLNKEATLLFLRKINGLVHPQLQYKLNSIKNEIKEFNFPIPNTPLFNKHFGLRKVTKIEKSNLEGNHRFNIEVENNHTYFANGILVANCHHVAATTFSSLLDGMYARYRIGLSGTMIRADGKHILFKDFFGSKVLQPPASHTLAPKILLVPTGIHLPAGEMWVKKINALLYDKEYQDLIASLARVQIVKGHKVLVIADRVEFLTNVKETLGADCILITGNTAYEERKALISGIETGEVSCIAGSRQIFSEGLSVNPLSCVILCSPTSNEVSLEQIIGRIMRLSPDKLQPVVLDMQFSSPVEKAQAKKRMAFYMNKGWEILNV